MDTELASRLEKIESHVAHLERQLEELNGVVVEQEKLLARLHASQRKIGETVETIELDRIRGSTSKPPHYQ
jgi:uncharacterized coiled-coil protein SlyX